MVTLVECWFKLANCLGYRLPAPSDEDLTKVAWGPESANLLDGPFLTISTRGDIGPRYRRAGRVWDLASGAVMLAAGIK